MMNPIKGKYNITKEEELKEIIKESILGKYGFPLVEIFDENKLQTVMYDLDFTLLEEKTVPIECLYQFVHIVHSILIKLLVPSYDNNIDAYILLKNKIEHNIELKNDKLHFGVHIWFPYIILNIEDRKILYDRVLEEAKAQNIFKDVSTIDSYETIIDKCACQRTSVMVYGASKPGKSYYKPFYQITDNFEIISIDEKEHNERFDHFYDLFKFNKENSKQSFFRKEKKKDQDKDTLIIEEDLKEQEENQKKETNQEGILDGKTIDWEDIDKLITMLHPSRAKEYHTWIQIALCLHNIDSSDFMKQKFITFSLQCPESCAKTNFDKLWSSLEHKKNGGYTIGTLKYLCKKDSPTKYQQYIYEYMDEKLLSTFFDAEGCNHFDIASVCFSIWGSFYVSGDLDKLHPFSSWYYFENHRWKRMKGAHHLYNSISTTLFKHYERKTWEYKKKKAKISADESLDKIIVESQIALYDEKIKILPR